MARTSIHPGEHLVEELSDVGVSASDLAREIGLSGNEMDGILSGRRPVTADIAMRLGHWFGTSAEFWLNLQKTYELRIAEREIGKHVAGLPRLKRRAAGERGP